MKLRYRYSGKGGTFYIGEDEKGKFHPLLNEESLGIYEDPHQAASDLAAGKTLAPDCSTFFELLGIPGDLKAWQKL